MAKKLTTNEYIAKAIAVHGDRYDYSGVEYSGARGCILIKCLKCESEFNVIASNHLIGAGCRCYRKQGRSMMSNTDFVKKCIEIHGSKKI